MTMCRCLHKVTVGRLLLTVVCLFLSGLCSAQYSKEQMYRAYITQNMALWDDYLHHFDWKTLNNASRAEYIGYEYGYVAAAIDEKQPDAKQHIDAFLAHIEAMEGVLPPSTLLTYRSSHAAYRAKAYPFEFASMGVKAMNMAKEAVQKDSLDVLALNLLGCVDFYAPALFGGSKERALQSFRTARRVYEERGDTVCNWNYTASLMQMAMCLDKTGHTDEAVALCRKMLAVDPDFRFIRDEYLPSLLKKK